MTGKYDLEGFDPIDAIYQGETPEHEGRETGEHGESKGTAQGTPARENQGAGGAAQIVLPGDARQAQQAYDEFENRIYSLVPRIEHSLEPHTRGGRKPKLLRYEVDMIRADGRSTRECAQHYGVSENTIRRVRQQGIYKNVPYIPADEYIRDVTMQGNGELSSVQPSMKERERGERTTTKRIGRPFPSGRAAFTNAELVDIASSDRKLRESAEKYNVSVSTIYNIKRRMRTAFPEGMTDIVQVALKDPRTPKQLAEQYGMSEKWFEEVRRNGYAVSSNGPITRTRASEDSE